MNIQPFFQYMVPSSDFQDDIARYTDAYAPGTAEHAETLAAALEHYGDEAWPYFLFSNMQVIGGMVIFTATFVAAVLYLRRRWILPFGSITLLAALLSLLFPFFTRFSHLEFIASLVVTGLIADVLIRWLTAADPLTRLRVRSLAMLLPLAIWVPYLLAIALFSGLGWGPNLYIGLMSTTAGVGLLMSLVMFPTPLPEGQEG
jgi:hypothetical protein